MTARLIRVKAWWLRVPLWSLWFPVLAVGSIITAAVSYPHRLFCADFWHHMAGAYLFGIEGL